ncbi:hypothetical protein PO654_25755 [Phytobacter diazotrophicus]|uniref:hypothetical protein n=1 Tax=Phytobacter diazotrophicus TaxID=395631 RepID=UPI000CD22BCF|nr:hypothetical protein C2U55_30030 [Enterobacteriaceae bacterium ENNIH3]AUV05047.1 hypothetical protein C2U52_01505 [Enterobacteriaceae bacterium ENNIH2]QIH66870.1 hypothetical protein CRX67_28365 [Enterobacteriaceae bacterium A-F18]
MFIAFAALDFLLIASGYYRKNLISYSLILTVLFLAPGVIRNNISEEYNVSKKITFYNVGLQVTTGIYCIDKTVMYKGLESIQPVDYPLQVLNDISFNGELKSKFYCEDNIFRHEQGEVLSSAAVLAAVTRNVITGCLVWKANTVN